MDNLIDDVGISEFWKVEIRKLSPFEIEVMLSWQDEEPIDAKDCNTKEDDRVMDNGTK